MKRLLNTLYVTTEDAYLSKDGTNAVVSVKGQERFRIPIQNVESICTFGYHGVSPSLMKLCAEQGVALNFFNANGSFIARIQCPVNGNVLLRTKQYAIAKDADTTLKYATRFISAKIFNSRVALRRFVRDHSQSPGVDVVSNCAEVLRAKVNATKSAKSLDELRGIEGDAAALYFKAMPYLLINKTKYFVFEGRNRRPPRDAVNAMLSFGYTLLANDCASALEGVGLDPAVGFLHALRPGRQSLALDLMEEFRSYLVDRLVISLINNRQIRLSDFIVHSSNGDFPVMMNNDGRKKFLTAWQNRKKDEITHPFLDEKTCLGMLPHIQAMLLARHMRGDLDDYPPFLVK